VALAEAEPFAQGAEQALVKASISRFAAVQVHPEEAREKIRAAAKAAVRRAGSIAPPDITLPARLDVETQTADMAQVASWVKGVERTRTRSVRIEGDDPLKIYRSFVALTYITRVSEGR
jgi:D-amino peptidase